MPFLVDSVTAELGRLGRAHPPRRPPAARRPPRRHRRAARGRSDDQDAGRGRRRRRRPSSPGCTSRSTGRPTRPSSRSSTDGAAPGAGRRPRGASRTGRRCATPRCAIADELAAGPAARCPDAEVAEARELLRWLADDHFTFLGYREYDLVPRWRRRRTRLVAVPGHRARHPARRPAGRPASFAALPPRGARQGARAALLVLTKANSRSTVHRPAYLDYVGVKTFDADGQVIGERRFLGLFTSSAYTRERRCASRCCGARSREVLERSGFAADSHSGKDLLEILETYPRDELFQISVEELLRDRHWPCMHLQERRQTRLFLRRTTTAGSCPAWSTCRATATRPTSGCEMEEILREAFDGEYRRLHRAGRPSRCWPGCTSSCGCRAGEAAAATSTPTSSRRGWSTATRSWVDDLAEALRRPVRRGGRRRPAPASTATRSPRRYKEDFPARTGRRRPRASSRRSRRRTRRALNLYEPLGAAPGERRFKIYTAGAAVAVAGAAGAAAHGRRGRRRAAVRDRAQPTAHGRLGLRLRAALRRPASGAPATTLEDAASRTPSRRPGPATPESDGFNALVLRGRADLAAGRRAARVREVPAADRLDVQPGLRRAVPARQRRASRALLVALFEARFDPDRRRRRPRRERSGRRAGRARSRARSTRSPASTRTGSCARYLALIRRRCAPTTTSATRDGRAAARTCRSSSTRSAVPDLPAPRPTFEIWVYSPRVEGVHLRFGAVARGGLRWSDRREDFRTEILGLVKAQMVKNAVIVPVGAKGGFVVKQLAADPARPRGRGWPRASPATARSSRRCSTSPTTWSTATVVPPPRRGAPRRRRPLPRRRGRQGHGDLLRHRQRGRDRLRLLARRRVRLRRLGRLRPQGDGHHRPRRLGVGQAALPRARASTPRPQDFTVVGVGDMSRRRVRQRHAAVRAHPAGRRLRPPARLPRPRPRRRRRRSPSAGGCSSCRARRGTTTTAR